MKIIALAKYRGRNPKGYCNRAFQWLYRLASKWGRDLPAWRFAILVGQAKRLALNPPTSAWGQSMLAKRGGLAVQRKYLLREGILPSERLKCDWPSNAGTRRMTNHQTLRPNRVIHLVWSKNSNELK